MNLIRVIPSKGISHDTGVLINFIKTLFYYSKFSHPCADQEWCRFCVREQMKLKLHKSWDEVKELLKEINSDITDEDLRYEEGKEEQLLQRLSQKIGKTNEDVKALIESVSYNEGKAS